MRKTSRLHEAAMDFADKGVLERIKGHDQLALGYFRQAFENERQAASTLVKKLDVEPTRSILYRSAASLALECNEIREAERLAAEGLSGNPPEEIAAELRAIFEEVFFRRNLATKGIILEPQRLDVTLLGNAIGPGITASDTYLERVSYLEKMMGRTAQRISGQPFQETVDLKKHIKKEIELFITAEKKGSFTVSLQVGRSEQLKLPWADVGPKILDEALHCLDLFATSNQVDLQERIKDPAYYRNFVKLARNLSPDGKDIRSVRFQSLKKDITLLTPRKQTIPADPDAGKPQAGETEQIRGVLKFADDLQDEKGKKGKIKIIDGDGSPHTVIVPPGLMDDIVGPLWKSQVIVTGKKKGKYLVLVDIEKA